MKRKTHQKEKKKSHKLIRPWKVYKSVIQGIIESFCAQNIVTNQLLIQFQKSQIHQDYIDKIRFLSDQKINKRIDQFHAKMNLFQFDPLLLSNSWLGRKLTQWWQKFLNLHCLYLYFLFFKWKKYENILLKCGSATI